MKTKKPDIFLGITMGMLVLAAVLCLVILFAQKAGNSKSTNSTLNEAVASGPASSSVPNASDKTTPSQNQGTPGESNQPVDPSGETPSGELPPETEPGQTNPTDPGTTPSESSNPGTTQPIDKAGLKAALTERLTNLNSEWQVTVIDPDDGTTVSLYWDKEKMSEKADSWMQANDVMGVFIMGAAYQAVADGALTEDQILADVKAAVCKADKEAANRVLELLGSGDAKAGREKVKEYAKKYDLAVGFNPSKEKPSENRSFMQTQYAAGLLNKLCKGELPSSNKMLEILLGAHENNVISYNLTDEGIRSGFVDGAADGNFLFSMGVMKLANGKTCVIAIACNGPKNMDSAKKIAVDVVNIAKEYFAE